MKQVLWQIQVTKLGLSTFLYDAWYRRGNLQKRGIKIGKMIRCKGLKIYRMSIATIGKVT